MKTKYEHIEEATTGLFDEHEMDITGLSEGIESYAKQQAIAFARAVLNTQWGIDSNLSNSAYHSDEMMYDNFVNRQDEKDNVTH